MARFGRGFGNEYDREFGARRDWGEAPERWAGSSGYNAGGGWPRNDRSFANDQGFAPGGHYSGGYDRTGRNFAPGGYDRGFRSFGGNGYDHGFRNAPGNRGGGYRGGHWGSPGTSSPPMSGRGPGYDHGFFGEAYDRPMRGSQRNFGDFRNSYLGPWF